MTTVAYNALKHTLETELGLNEQTSQDSRDVLHVASTRNPQWWALAIESGGSWANLWYPQNTIRDELMAWVGVMNRHHPHARYFRWNGSVVFEEQSPSAFITKIYYDMEPVAQE